MTSRRRTLTFLIVVVCVAIAGLTYKIVTERQQRNLKVALLLSRLALAQTSTLKQTTQAKEATVLIGFSLPQPDEKRFDMFDIKCNGLKILAESCFASSTGKEGRQAIFLLSAQSIEDRSRYTLEIGDSRREVLRICVSDGSMFYAASDDLPLSQLATLPEDSEIAIVKRQESATVRGHVPISYHMSVVAHAAQLESAHMIMDTAVQFNIAVAILAPDSKGSGVSVASGLVTVPLR